MLNCFSHDSRLSRNSRLNFLIYVYLRKSAAKIINA
jgi:hypothetical protein